MIKTLLVRIVLCAAASAACYFMLSALLGATGQSSEKSVLWAMTIVASSALWAAALARPLMEIVPAAYNGLRWLVWRKEEGQWYAYEGRRLRVVTVDGVPWIAVRDIAAVMAWKNLEVRCRQLPPEQCQAVGDKHLLYLSEAGIPAVFAKRTDPEAVRFGLWIERNVLIRFRLAQERGTRFPRT